MKYSDRYSWHARLKYKILLANNTCCFLPSITNTTTTTIFFSSTNLCYPVFLGDFKEFISHGIFGNFILLNLLTLGFKLQNWHLHITTDDSRASEFLTNKDKLETNLFFKIYLNAVLPNRVPFGISLFLFCSSTLSSSNTLVSTDEIAR